ncbi:hypothetical protein CJF32_00002515 [Rutstroemia sp. NJR-2017a WRK4]|nr:hypothetical protein CJF32_00002515 [Rutstroemia sp. NJR-2017a WRK4]
MYIKSLTNLLRTSNHMLLQRSAPTVFSVRLSSALTSTVCAPNKARFPCTIARDCIFQPRRSASSSSSSTRWKTRQGRDLFAKEARVQGLKSRAAFKLLELLVLVLKDASQIDSKYKIFKKGQTVVDLGYAPGSWSQVSDIELSINAVAVDRTKPRGRIIGIDIIPAQPPKGVSTIQGNFLSTGVQEEVKRFLLDPDRGRPIKSMFDEDSEAALGEELSYIELERHADDAHLPQGKKAREEQEQGRMVDVVLSDMSAPWDQTTGFWKRSLSDPYIRMMNTTGIKFSDHAGSMDLCAAALRFAFDTLKAGGHFVCKFYQGAEDKQLEKQLRRMFGSVHREKPESSRSVSTLICTDFWTSTYYYDDQESKEAYFVALRRKDNVKVEDMGF